MFLGDLDARGLKQPEFVIVDGAPGLEAALVALSGARPCRSSAVPFGSTVTCLAMPPSTCMTN
jgi:hypothetical protein